MDLQRALTALHILLGIVLTGQALFWFVMNVSLRRDFDEARTVELLRTTQSARWPHVAVPWKLRLPLPWVGWLTLLLLAVTGAYLIHVRGAAPTGTAWHLKMSAFAALLVVQAMLQRHPLKLFANLGLLLALLAMASAALSIR
jgi:hypothetical protein